MDVRTAAAIWDGSVVWYLLEKRAAASVRDVGVSLDCLGGMDVDSPGSPATKRARKHDWKQLEGTPLRRLRADGDGLDLKVESLAEEK